MSEKKEETTHVAVAGGARRDGTPVPEKLDFEVRVVSYVLDRKVKATTREEAKRLIREQFLATGGYSTSLIFEARQIKWLHEPYPRDVGFEPLEDWK